MAEDKQAFWWRALMATLAVPLLVFFVEFLRELMGDRDRFVGDWFLLANFFLLPAALWMFAALRFGASFSRWRQFGSATAGGYAAYLIAWGLIATRDEKDFSHPWISLALTAMAFGLFLLAAPMVWRLLPTEEAETRGREGLERILAAPFCLAAGAAGTCASLFLSMETGTGWEVLRAKEPWVTASYGAADWVRGAVDWIARVDYGLVILLTLGSLALLVPRVRTRLSTRANRLVRQCVVAATLLLVVDLFCGWTVFVTHDAMFPEYGIGGSLVTLGGGAAWLLTVVVLASDSPRARQLTVVLLWLILPALALDLGSITFLAGLEMYGTIALLLGMLLTALGVAQLTTATRERPAERALAAVA